MHVRCARPRRAVFTAVVGAAALAASVIAPGATVTAAATGSGAMQPAIGVHPHFVPAGSVIHTAQGAMFHCQTTTPAECYGPAQIKAAYGVDKLAAQGLDGLGRTIVIVDAYSSPTITQDLAAFDSLFGLPDAHLQVIAPQGMTAFNANDPTQVGWSGEITLDVEWAHAIAPDAAIRLVLARSSNDADILAATNYAVAHNLGDVISQSFGEAEQCMNQGLLAAQHRLFARATAMGITLLASAGDSGAAQPTCDGSSYFQAASTPASDPNVTGVGGTRLVANGITGAYQSESVWNDQFGAGGGGFSVVYATPRYQRSLGLTSRGVPDVSYNAAVIGGVLTVWTDPGLGQGVFLFGGTSAGTPQWAGIVALADQLHHGRVGEINAQLYAAARHESSYATDFHDVTVGNNGALPITAGFDAAPGWDAASGLGTPQADQLVPMLAQRALVGSSR
ncbi:MAG: S53 family peptidase [Propionibacterium sp.]|nr:S53 family peptidase [Propionibacterium sp.]